MMDAILVAQLDNTQIDELLYFVPNYTEINRDSIRARCLAKIQKGNTNINNNTISFSNIENNKRKRLIIILVAAIAAALVGFTNIDRIQQLFTRLFGSAGAQLSHSAQTIQKSSYDQGIRADVLAGFYDGGNTYLFVDLTDETNDRLAKKLFFIDGMDFVVKGKEDEWHGMGCEQILYDKSSRTATLYTETQGGQPGDDAIFTLNRIYSGEVQFAFQDKQTDLYDLINSQNGSFIALDASGGVAGSISMKFMEDGRKLSEISEVLDSDAIHVEIPGYDKGYLSNIGYKDGYLHLQFNPDNDAGNYMRSAKLINKITDEEILPYYSVLTGSSITDDNVLHEYAEDVFAIKDRDSIKNYALYLSGIYYTEVIEGNWEVNFKVPSKIESVVVPANKTVPINGNDVKISEITISPYRIDFIAVNPCTGLLQATALYNDGTRSPVGAPIEIPDYTSIGIEAGDVPFRIIGPILNFEDLAAVEINGIRFDMQ